jgi:hypothetical protein
VLQASELAAAAAELTVCKQGLQYPQADAVMPALRLLVLKDDAMTADTAKSISIADFKVLLMHC